MDATSVHRVGALVRVLVPKLGPEWQIGMFNRIRVEPPCYLVSKPPLTGGFFTRPSHSHSRSTLCRGEEALLTPVALEVGIAVRWDPTGLFT